MKKTAKMIMSFLTAMTMTAGAMGVTAYAEENDGNTYQYNYSEADKIEVTPEMEPVIELKCNEMKQYLLENAVPENIVDEIVSNYAKEIPIRIYFGNIGYDGNEASIDANGMRNFCLNLALLMMQREQFGVDSKTEADIEHKLWQLAVSAVPAEDSRWDPPVSGYVGEKIAENESILKGGVKYHHNPETNVTLLDGDGTLTHEDVFDIIVSLEPHDNIIVIGKDVQFEILSNIDEDGNEVYDEFSASLRGITCISAFNTYIYENSAAETEYHTMKAVVEKALIESGASNTNDEYHSANFLDNSVDPYDILNGKVDVTKNEQPVTEATTAPETDTVSEATVKEETEVKVLAEKPASTMKGDADLNGEVSLTDVVVVSKNNLSDEAYPLANDTAYENADMNNDSKVNGLDASALIENQLGKKDN